MEPLAGVTFLRGNFTLPEGKGLIRDACAGQAPDLIISYHAMRSQRADGRDV